MTELYQPKGSMCASCKYVKKDCSRLDFKNMPFIYRFNNNGNVFNTVKCTNFERKE